MAFDGITVAALTAEFQNRLLGGRISKIIQPESDEILMTIRTETETTRLLISASASLPLAYLDAPNKKAPMTAPNFCMLLRKHILGGRIRKIEQPGLERCIHFEIEHMDEMRDLATKTLILEIMGKHSNLIFVNQDGMILDSIKHVGASMSSIREVLPGREYFLPDTMHKADPLSISKTAFHTKLHEDTSSVAKAMLHAFTGISPVMTEELCFRSEIDPRTPAASLNDTENERLFHHFLQLMEDVKHHQFSPEIYYREELPTEYSAIPLSLYQTSKATSFSSISNLLAAYYKEKEIVTRIRQKSADLRRIVQTALDRTRKKEILQETQLKSTEKRDKFRLYGELLSAYSYQLPENVKQVEVENYYTNEPVVIPMDEQKTPAENAKHYFDRYQKLKRTFEAVTVQLAETKDEVSYLESVSQSIDMARTESDLNEIRKELKETGLIRSHRSDRKVRSEKSIPLHYQSTDGFDIYVGKNNLQNEELSFKVATGNDWWFHAKQMPGSHVIVKTNGRELPDRTFEEAASLAAHYSKGAQAEKVEIDYVQKKHLKKPNGAKPGFVIYHTNYSMTASTNIKNIRQITE